MNLNKPFLLYISLFFCATVYAQLHQQIEFSIANDKFVLRDRYYTNGLFLNYKIRTKEASIFKADSSSHFQHNFSITNQTYTPTNLSSTNVMDFDRPFAGWLTFNYGLTKINNHTINSLNFTVGITGKESLSGDLQIWFHNLLGIDGFVSWEEQIDFKLLFNINYQYIYNWSLNKRHSLQYELNPALGTKDIFVGNKIHYFFGKFNDLKNSSRVGLISSSNRNEFYGFMSISHRFIAHNTLIEGSLFKEDILFTTDAVNNMFKYDLGAVFKHKRNTIKLVYSTNSKETSRSTSHSYGTLSYSLDF